MEVTGIQLPVGLGGGHSPGLSTPTPRRERAQRPPSFFEQKKEPHKPQSILDKVQTRATTGPRGVQNQDEGRGARGQGAAVQA